MGHVDVGLLATRVAAAGTTESVLP